MRICDHEMETFVEGGEGKPKMIRKEMIGKGCKALRSYSKLIVDTKWNLIV